MMTALVAVMMLKVIPQFQDFYAGLDVELPPLTVFLMNLAITIRDNVHWLLLALAAAWVAGVLWMRRPGSPVVRDRLLLRVPYLGGLMRMYATSQLSRTLSALLSGGLPLVNALEVAANSIGNRAMAEAAGSATGQIREGRSLTSALETTSLMDNLTLEMVKVGEQTGALADMLNAVADFYDEELENRLAKVLALVEPIMLVIMAVLVALMLLAFYMPMFEAISAVQRR
jgi:type IV pilus assembly protein PilC